MITISIITVVYNARETIRDTIESVVLQNYPQTEYIIIDGGSTDGTLDVIREYAAHISALISEKDDGIYDAMNKGLRQVNGDVVAFLNADDTYEEGALQAVAAAYEDDPELELVYGDHDMIRENSVSRVVSFENYLDTVIGFRACHQTVFARKSLIDRAGPYDLKYRVAADYDWMLRAGLMACKTRHIKELVCRYRLGGFSEKNALEDFSDAYSSSRVWLKGEDLRKAKDRFLLNLNTYYWKAYLRTDEKRKILFETIRPFIDKDMAIYGCGFYGMNCADLLLENGCGVVCFLDTQKSGYHNGIPIISLDEFKKQYRQKILICSLFYEEEIIKDLKDQEMQDYCKLTDLMACHLQRNGERELPSQIVTMIRE